MTTRSVLLIVGGGIAAYKSLLLIRLLKKAGYAVTCVLTKAGAEFVTPLSLSALSEEKVYDDLFSLTDEVEMGHIELSRAADLLVVAPATADLMAKAAHGHANDLASTVILATDKPVLYAPAMNVRMWEHPATRRNVRTLAEDGALFVGPDEGAMACGEYGEGRLAEPEAIFEAIQGFFARRLDVTRTIEGPKALRGRHVLVTAGPTHEPIDPVRYLANRSSGRQGYAIAAAARDLGARVTLVTGPTEIAPPPGLDVVRVETAREMLAAVEAARPFDVGVFAAAVADWRAAEAGGAKIKKTGNGPPPPLALVENPDILQTIAQGANRPPLVVGFAAETDDVLANARKKLLKKGADVIVANDVRPETGIMGGARNRVTLVTADGEEPWPELSKEETARRLMAWAAARLAQATAQAAQ